MAQEDYDRFCRSTDPKQQETFCGSAPSVANGNEWYFIQSKVQNNILDVGCGSGHRTFPDFITNGLKFYGIEKFDNLIKASRYKDKIIQADVMRHDFFDIVNAANLPERLGPKIDLIALFGGVINGWLDESGRMTGWQNIARLLEEMGEYLLVDTISSFPWFETSDNGRSEQLHAMLPIQYFYSKPELSRIFSQLGLVVVEEVEETLGSLKRTHFLLQTERAFKEAWNDLF